MKPKVQAGKVLVAMDFNKPPYGYTILKGKATEHVPRVTGRWLAEAAMALRD